MASFLLLLEKKALYRNMPVRVYNDTPTSDVSVQFNHGILPCPVGVVELEEIG